jgi:hypothetical protein
MGTPTRVDKHDYPTEYRVKDKRGEWHVQCDCIVLVTIKKAEERTQAKLEVESSYINLFRIDSSQSQSQRSDCPPSPPPRQRKKREKMHVLDYSEDEEQFPEEVVEDSDDDGGGKRGGGVGGGGSARRGSSVCRNT